MNTGGKQSVSPFFIAVFLVLTGVCAALHVWKVPPALPFMQWELGMDLVQSGFLMVVLPSPALIKHITDAVRLSRVMGLWGCYMPAGAVLMLWAGAGLAVGFWRTLWLVLGILTAIVMVLTFLLVPADSQTQTKSTVQQSLTHRGSNLLRTTLSSGQV